MSVWLFLSALIANTSFPEQTPGMIESCIVEAVHAKNLSKENGSHKYICGGDAAQVLWDFLERAKVESWEQTTENGVWLSRRFPLGGCFKRVRNVDGSAANSGLSCTIWVPYRIRKAD